MAGAMWAQTSAKKSYRLDFVVTEGDSGAAVSARKYSLVGESGGRVRLRAGARVPYQNGNQLNYADVGTNFDCVMGEQESGLRMECSLEISSAGSGSPPRIQQHRVEVSTMAPLEKASKLVDIQDPVTDKKIEITVTPRKL